MDWPSLLSLEELKASIQQDKAKIKNLSTSSTTIKSSSSSSRNPAPSRGSSLDDSISEASVSSARVENSVIAKPVAQEPEGLWAMYFKSDPPARRPVVAKPRVQAEKSVGETAVIERNQPELDRGRTSGSSTVPTKGSVDSAIEKKNDDRKKEEEAGFKLWNSTTAVATVIRKVNGGEEEDLDSLWDQGKVDNEQAFSAAAAGPKRDVLHSDHHEKVQRGKRLFAEEGAPKRSRSTASKQSRIVAVEEDDTEETIEEGDEALIRPQFNDLNVAASRLPCNGPLVLDESRGLQVHQFANRYLMDYQREGVKFMFNSLSQKDTKKAGCILNDDMGLGKTIQVIALLLALLKKKGTGLDKLRVKQRSRARGSSNEKRRMLDVPSQGDLGTILIVAPKSVQTQWAQELETWGYFDVEVIDSKKTADEKEDVIRSCEPHLKQSIVCNPEILLMTYPFFSSASAALKAVKSVHFRLIIFDEVHMLRNIKAKTTMNARSLTAKCTIGLTGTLMQNNLKEFWTILTNVNRKALATWSEFDEYYAKPIKRAR